MYGYKKTSKFHGTGINKHKYFVVENVSYRDTRYNIKKPHNSCNPCRKDPCDYKDSCDYKDPCDYKDSNNYKDSCDYKDSCTSYKYTSSDCAVTESYLDSCKKEEEKKRIRRSRRRKHKNRDEEIVKIIVDNSICKDKNCPCRKKRKRITMEELDSNYGKIFLKDTTTSYYKDCTTTTHHKTTPCHKKDCSNSDCICGVDLKPHMKCKCKKCSK